MNLLDVPEDALSLIFILLTPKEFLSLCRSSKILYTNYHQDPFFWRTKVFTAFRIPISPLLKADGARWYSLFHRLKTQTKLYTWGQGLKGNLGQGIGINRRPRIRGHGLGRMIHDAPRLRYQKVTSSWPTESHVPPEIGVIADLQCGGWSTIILSSAGELYAIGSINSSNFFNVGISTDQFERLEYLTQSTSAISHFSAGRSHVLALTGDNEVVSWDRVNAKGLKVLSRDAKRFPGRPSRVVAGWDQSSAYIPEVGIVYWTPLKNDQEDVMLDARPVNDKIIPNTARSVTKEGTTEVAAYILLEVFVVWITIDSQVWACDIGRSNVDDTEPLNRPVRLPGFTADGVQLSDIQGSFRTFAVFTSSGRVLACDTDYIERFVSEVHVEEQNNPGTKIDFSEPETWNRLSNIAMYRPRDIPALQNTGVISVKFGDYHYHALHSDGKITAHGHEPGTCGAMGLGNPSHGARLRSMYVSGERNFDPDSRLRPVADLRGRQVWFEPDKLEWLKDLQKTAEDMSAQNPHEAYWSDILNDPTKQTMFSEWIEQEGRHWEDENSVNYESAGKEQKSTNDAYFALAIGAAGWHSGALVLVDEQKADKVREKWWDGENPVWSSQQFPRIEFPDGTQSPQPHGLGEGEQTLASALRPWRDGMPTMEELGLDRRD